MPQSFPKSKYEFGPGEGLMSHPHLRDKFLPRWALRFALMHGILGKVPTVDKDKAVNAYSQMLGDC